MWIERIDFAGFGDICGEKIEFAANKLNLIVEPNSYGKSSIATAIWAILYGFPKDTAALDFHRPRPELNVPFIASIDINSGGRRLKIIRDFSDNAVQVIDIGQVNKDVTREFRGTSSQEEVGQRIFGMTREMFRSICFVGQNDLASHAVAGQEDCASLFKSIADSATIATSAGSALEVIDGMLTAFPYKDAAQPVEKLLQELERRHGEMTARINKMQNDKLAQTEAFKRIEELEQQIQQEVAAQAAAPAPVNADPTPGDQYFALCLEAADLDNQLIRAQEKFGKAQEKPAAKSTFTEDKFPVDQVKSVEDLWIRRTSRKIDYQKLFDDVSPRMRDHDAQDKNLRDKWQGADKFTGEEGQQIGVLALNLRNAKLDVDDLQRKRLAEMSKFEGAADFNRLDQARKQVLALDPKDHEDSRSYMALLTSFLDGIAEAEKSIARSQMIMGELEDPKKAKKGIFPLPGGGKKKEQIAAEQEIEKQNSRIAELKNKIVGLEVRLDTLARRSGMADGQQLLNYLKDYNNTTVNFKGLDALDQMIVSRESHLTRAVADLEIYFQRAGRATAQITPDSALALADEIQRYHDDTRNMNNAFNAVNQSRQQLDFLVGEIQDIEDFLFQIFAQAEVSELDSVENAYNEYLAKLSAYRNQQSEGQSAVNQELLTEINRLEGSRAAIWTSMQSLVEKFPDIAENAPQAGAKKQLSVAEQNRRFLEGLRTERDQLQVKLRQECQQYDQLYLPTVEEREQLERNLHKIRRAKAGLELARTTLRTLSGKGQQDWSVRLNEEAEEMVLSLGSNFEQLQFDSELHVSAKKKTDARTFGTAQGASALGNGMTRQMNLLARLILTKFLSVENSLPLILDEPFNEFDDERFLKFMQFLLESFPPDHQVIIFSCHRVRHQWLLSQLQDELKAKLGFARRASLRPAPKA